MDADQILVVLGVALALVLLRLAVGAIRGLAHQARVREAEREEIRRLVELRLAELVDEFPRATDQEIATLMRDELQNERCTTAAVFHYASAETAGRVRRTAIVAALRERRERGEDE